MFFLSEIKFLYLFFLYLEKIMLLLIKNNGIPSNLAGLIPSESHLYNTWNTKNINITTYPCRTDAFKYYWMVYHPMDDK